MRALRALGDSGFGLSVPQGPETLSPKPQVRLRVSRVVGGLAKAQLSGV